MKVLIDTYLLMDLIIALRYDFYTLHGGSSIDPGEYNNYKEFKLITKINLN
jgi:hypothetical protein